MLKVTSFVEKCKQMPLKCWYDKNHEDRNIKHCSFENTGKDF